MNQDRYSSLPRLSERWPATLDDLLVCSATCAARSLRSVAQGKVCKSWRKCGAVSQSSHLGLLCRLRGVPASCSWRASSYRCCSTPQSHYTTPQLHYSTPPLHFSTHNLITASHNLITASLKLITALHNLTSYKPACRLPLGFAPAARLDIHTLGSALACAASDDLSRARSKSKQADTAAAARPASAPSA